MGHLDDVEETVSELIFYKNHSVFFRNINSLDIFMTSNRATKV